MQRGAGQFAADAIGALADGERFGEKSTALALIQPVQFRPGNAVQGNLVRDRRAIGMRDGPLIGQGRSA